MIELDLDRKRISLSMKAHPEIRDSRESGSRGGGHADGRAGSSTRRERRRAGNVLVVTGSTPRSARVAEDLAAQQGREVRLLLTVQAQTPPFPPLVTWCFWVVCILTGCGIPPTLRGSDPGYQKMHLWLALQDDSV